MINLLRNLKIVIVLYFFSEQNHLFVCHQYFQSLPEVNLKSWIFQLFCFSIFFFDICRVYRDSFQSAKYMICFQIDKSETLVLIFSPEFCLRDFSVTFQWFSMKCSGIMRIYENLIHLGGNVKMPFRCQVMDNFLILKWFFVSERSKERLIIWTGNLLEMIVHDL